MKDEVALEITTQLTLHYENITHKHKTLGD
jgi:hypothetical protein